MSEAAKTSAEAISSLLTGLASALTDAQEAMADLPPTDAFGRPMPVYQIPELNFSFEIETVETKSANPNATALARYSLQPSTTGPKGSITSTISGRIVAIPPNGGLPETQIIVTQGDRTLNVQLVNSAGELLQNTLVELEFDADASNALHGVTLTPARRLSLLGSQQVTTDTSGKAETTVKRSNLQAGQSAVVLVRAAGAETRVTISREA